MSKDGDDIIGFSSFSSAALNDTIRSGRSDSSETELVLVGEADQDVDYQFYHNPEELAAMTSDTLHQPIAKLSLTTKASTKNDAFQTMGVEEFIPRRRTSMLTIQDDNVTIAPSVDDFSHLEIVSADVLEERARRKRMIVISALAVIGTVALIAGGLALKRALSK